MAIAEKLFRVLSLLFFAIGVLVSLTGVHAGDFEPKANNKVNQIELTASMKAVIESIRDAEEAHALNRGFLHSKFAGWSMTQEGKDPATTAQILSHGPN